MNIVEHEVSQESLVGLCPVCEKVIAASVKRFSQPKDLEATAREWAASGMRIESMTTEQIRELGWCKDAQAHVDENFASKARR